MIVSCGDSAPCMHELDDRCRTMQLERVVKFTTNYQCNCTKLIHYGIALPQLAPRIVQVVAFPSVQYSARLLIARIQKQTAADAAV